MWGERAYIQLLENQSFWKTWESEHLLYYLSLTFDLSPQGQADMSEPRPRDYILMQVNVRALDGITNDTTGNPSARYMAGIMMKGAHGTRASILRWTMWRRVGGCISRSQNMLTSMTFPQRFKIDHSPISQMLDDSHTGVTTSRTQAQHNSV